MPWWFALAIKYGYGEGATKRRANKRPQERLWKSWTETQNSEMPQPRWKRVEIQGFKTFASRAEFDLPEGIVAFVGPNGSGKSNSGRRHSLGHG